MLKKNQPGSSSCSPPTETVIAGKIRHPFFRQDSIRFDLPTISIILDFPISTTTALNKVHNGDNLQHVHSKLIISLMHFSLLDNLVVY